MGFRFYRRNRGQAKKRFLNGYELTTKTIRYYDLYEYIFSHENCVDERIHASYMRMLYVKRLASGSCVSENVKLKYDLSRN